MKNPLGVRYAQLDDQARRPKRLVWPNPKYQHDLIGFAQDICGAALWSEQLTMAKLFDENPFTAIKSGHKCGKTALVALHALRCFCSYPDCCFIALAPTINQVGDAFWKQLSWWYQRSGICLACRDAGVTEAPCEHSTKIDGQLAERPETGLKAGFREVFGLAASNPNNVSSRGGKIFWYVDEAAGVKDSIFEAIMGTMAGHQHLILTLNPTSRSGFAYNAFHKDQKLWTTVTLSSERSPYITGEADPKLQRFGALATKEWVEREKATLTSAQYANRVLGEFAIAGADEMVATHDLAISHARPIALDPGSDVCIGIDVASGHGDTWVFSVANGSSILQIVKRDEVDALGAISVLEDLLASYEQSGRPTRVQYDGLGPFGRLYANQLTEFARSYPGRIRPLAINGQADAKVKGYIRLRDVVIANLAHRLRNDLAVPSDDEFDEECLQLRWDTSVFDRTGMAKVLDKHKIRQELHRSPDTCDAVAYSAYDPKSPHFVGYIAGPQVPLQVAPPPVRPQQAGFPVSGLPNRIIRSPYTKRAGW